MMLRQVSLLRFCLQAGGLFLLLTVGWLQVSAWTSYPAASLAKIILDSQAEDWVESTQNVPGQLKAKTKFAKILPDKRMATAIAVVEPAHYAYGTTLFLALLVACRSRHFFRSAIAGYGLLLFPQAFSLVMVLLGQILREVPMEPLGIGMWQADAIRMGNMFGMLILPILAPVALWMWLEWDFLETLMKPSLHPSAQ